MNDGETMATDGDGERAESVAVPGSAMSAALAGMAAEIDKAPARELVNVAGDRDGALVTEQWDAADATREALAAANMWIVRSFRRREEPPAAVARRPRGSLPPIGEHPAAAPGGAARSEAEAAAGPEPDAKSAGRSEAEAAGAKAKPPKGPIAMAKAIMATRSLVADDGGQIHTWNGRHWQGLSKHGALALAFDGGSQGASSARDEIVKYWQAAAFVPGELWRRVGTNEVPLGNGVLNIDTNDLRPHDPEDYLDRVIPHDYDPTATCDFWMESLEQWFGSLTDDRVVALQEFAGYCLTSHAKYKKALFLFGPSGTGKSRVVEALSALVGRAYICSIGLELLDDPKRVVLIKGKSLNVVTELPDGALIKDGAFKALVSTEEPIMVDAKYKAVETYTPTAKHVIATNTLPAIADRSEATFNRLLIINMNRPIAKAAALAAGEVDDRIAAEAPGVVNWALDGLRRLYKAGGEFTAPASSRELIQGYRLEQNPLEQFIAERCRRTLSTAKRRHGVTTDRFVEAFNAWHRGGRPWSKTRVSRTLTTMALPGIEVIPVKWHGVSVRTVVGLELVPAKELPPVELEVDADGAGHAVPEPAADEREAIGDDPTPASDERAV